MKDIFIIYDRYEHDEWYHVYHLCTNETKAWKYLREHALPDFLNYGPDDCHAFQLQRVVMSDYKYRKLRALVNADDKEAELRLFMMGIFHESEYEVDTLAQSDGCSDNIEIAKLYCEENGLDYDEDYDAVWDALSEEEVWDAYLAKYINQTY